MKKFIVKIMMFAMIIIIISLGVNCIYVKWDKSDSQNINKFKNITSPIMICNFGSSHGVYGFNYEDIEYIECFNFALTSQRFSYDRRLFDYYKNRIAKGAVVFIPISYFSFYGVDECMEEDFLNKNKRYYKILPPEMIKKYDLKTDFYERYFPSLSAGGVNLLKVFLGRSEDAGDGIWLNMASDMDVNVDAQKAYERHLVANKLDANGNKIVNEEEVEALKYMIKESYEMGFIPILVTPPFLSEYTNEIKNNAPDFWGDFYDMINKIVEETGVSYYDYAFDKRFIKKYEWFMNVDHLNKEGARQFVNILMDEIVCYENPELLIRTR